jgi:hypothetical protein
VPGSKSERPVAELAQQLALSQGVLKGSRADLSFVAGLLVDKFCWHLPPNRQHQRPLAAGFKPDRQCRTQIMQQAGRLLHDLRSATRLGFCFHHLSVGA